MSHHLIAMEGVCKHYALASGEITPVLKEVDLFIEPGEFVAIMGPSGSGKSTLMNIMGTLDRPNSGLYLLDEEDVGNCNDKTLARLRNGTIGFVFQGFNLLPRRTILDNVALPLFYSGEPAHERKRRAEHYLTQVGLLSHRDYYPSQLSGGQQQRVAIARALIGEPKLILADEPTGNLDSNTSKDIMDIFSSLNREGMTVVLVTHEQDIAQYSKRLIQVKDGRILYDGPTY